MPSANAISLKSAGGQHSEAARATEVDLDDVSQILGQSPTAELQAMMTEQCEQMLGELEDVRLRVVALCKLEGYLNEEIARTFETTTRSVERWLRRIRKQWEERA